VNAAHRSLAAPRLRVWWQGFWAWVATRRVLARARRLYEFAQGISAQGNALALQRAARLHRRALSLLEPGTRVRELDRFEARERVRRRLFDASLLGWLSHHAVPLAGALVMIALIVAALAGFVPSVHRRLFRPDVALGKHWVASSAQSGYAKEGTIDASTPVNAFFHTLDEPSPSITIDLRRVRRLREVVVRNRLDCCAEHALPLIIELSKDGTQWDRVAYRRALFDSFAVHFTVQPARYVRVRVDRQSMLHLSRISVY
jgi:hypothetical protein